MRNIFRITALIVLVLAFAAPANAAPASAPQTPGRTVVFESFMNCG
jgi:hypothetical protein